MKIKRSGKRIMMEVIMKDGGGEGEKGRQRKA